MENAEIIWHSSQGEDHAFIILPEGTPLEVQGELYHYASRDKNADSVVILTPDQVSDLLTRLAIAAYRVGNRANPEES